MAVLGRAEFGARNLTFEPMASESRFSPPEGALRRRDVVTPEQSLVRSVRIRLQPAKEGFAAQRSVGAFVHVQRSRHGLVHPLHDLAQLDRAH